MKTVRMWRSVQEDRLWAEIGDQGRGHLLAQLLHGNLYNATSCEMALVAAKKAAADRNYIEDLGFFDSVALYFSEGHVQVEHAVAEYGVLSLSAEQFALLLTQWSGLVADDKPIELLMDIDLP